MNSKSRKTLVIAAMAISLSLAACGGGAVSGEEVADDSNSELDTIELGTFPAATFGAVEIADRAGIFEDHGIDLVMNSGQDGGAATLPAVSTGDIDIGVGNPVSVMTGAAQGLDVRIIAGYGRVGPSIDNSAAVVALDGSGIDSAADLEGIRIGINSLNGALELSVREAVELDGGDPTTLQFVEMGFPDMAAQLENGEVDAAVMGQPFMGSVLAANGEVVVENQKEAGVEDAALITFTSGRFIEENPELLERFLVAWREALEYAAANEDEHRAVLPDFIGMDPDLAESLPLELVSAEIDRNGLETYAELMSKWEIVADTPDLDSILYAE